MRDSETIPPDAVTFLFTDIEGSTKRWEAAPAAMAQALAQHDDLLRWAIEAHGGVVFKTVGDAFCATFTDPTAALKACLVAQRSLSAIAWGEVGPVRVRMALHTGEPELRAHDYFAPPVNRVARLLATGYGGQILVSAATAAHLEDGLPPDVTLNDMGRHRLKDLLQPERIFQVAAPGLETSFPPLKSLDRQPHNLPAQPTMLVGREREVAATRALLEDGARLVTLTGPGGTGKTRLGLQVAAELVDTLRDGAWFVPLAPLTDSALVVPAIAGVLGVRETGHEPLETTLLEELAAKELLLLLDNFEHLTVAAPMLGRIIANCPKVRLLVTSRATLRVYGERELDVPPLALPDLKRLPLLGELAAVAAVELFVERAVAIRPDFGLSEANAAAVAAICVRLEGLPLAIELAAARVRILPPDKLLDRLTKRLDLLTGGAADRDARQQTLRGAIAWSYDLLAPAEQTLFRRLGVFAGGTFEAIEAVCGGAGAGEILDGLESLVTKSLLRQEEGGEGPRFFLLETIREFALERLQESGEGARLREAHAATFLELAEQAEPALRRPEQATWLERLEAEHDNLRAALGWSEEVEDTETGLRLAASLRYFWWVRGHVTEGRRWLERALERGQDGSPVARAKALAEAGFLAQQQGDYAQAYTLLDHSLTLCHQAGDTLGAAHALGYLGLVAELRGDYELAELQYEESLATYRELRDKRGINLGLNWLGALAFSKGNYDQATAYFKEQLKISRELRDTKMVAFALCNLAETLQHQGNVERAVALYGEALPLLEGLGDKRAAAEVSSCLGRLELSQGNGCRAHELLCESLVVLQELGDKAAVAACLEALASVVTEQGAALEAARLFGAADALRETIGVPLPPAYRSEYDRHVGAARTIEQQIFFAAAWEEGRALSLDQAVAEALVSSPSQFGR